MSSRSTITLAMLGTVCLLATPADGAKSLRAKNHMVFANPDLDEVALLNLSKDAAIKCLGQPDKILGPEAGYQTYDYSERHQISVVFRDEKVVQYIVDADSSAITIRGISSGSSMADVQRLYGKCGASEVVEKWFGGRQPRVVYHHEKYQRYKINYPKHDVIFMFDRNKKVDVIWVGYIFPIDHDK